MTALWMICLIIWVLGTRYAIALWTQPLAQPESDVWYHLLLARDIRSGGHRIPQRFQQFLMPGRVAYPYLVHWVLSWLRPPTMLRADFHFGALMDLVHALILVYSVFLCTQWIPELSAASPAAATVGALAWFAFSPSLALPGEARLQIGGRAVGEMLATVYCLFLLRVAAEPSWMGMALCGVAGALVLLSSKFAAQALAAFSLVTSLWAVSLFPLVAICIALVLALGVSLGGYWTVLKGHVQHSVFYYGVLQKRHPATVGRRCFVNRGTIRKAFRYSAGAGILSLLSKDHVLPHALLHCPLILATWVAYLRWGSHGTAGGAIRVCEGWLIAGTSAFLLTSIPRLRFLGEAERYLDFLFLPATILWLAAESNGHSLFSAGALLASVGIQVFYLGVKWKVRSRSRAEALHAWAGMWAELAHVAPDAVTLVLPHKMSQPCAFGSTASYAYHQSGFARSYMSAADFGRLYETFPKLTDVGARHLIGRYAVARIVATGAEYRAQALRIAPDWRRAAEFNGTLILTRPPIREE
jgi:hypothetical protein